MLVRCVEDVVGSVTVVVSPMYSRYRTLPAIVQLKHRSFMHYNECCGGR